MKNYFKTNFIILQSALAVAANTLCAEDATQHLPQFYMGTCTHFAQYKGIAEINLDMIKDCGFNSIRDDMYWSNVEIAKGKYEYPPAFLAAPKAAKERGIEQLTVIAYGNKNYANGAYPESDEAIEGYANFAADTAKTIAPHCALLQVWNEWDGGCGMSNFKGKSTQAGYAKLLEASYKKIKKSNPNAIVIQNSFCTGDAAFEESLKNGIIKNCDVLSLHTYNHSQSKLNRTPEAWHKRMAHIEEIVKKYNGGKTMPLFVTEMGFNNQTGSAGYGFDQSANYAARLYLLARTFPWVKGVWWYDFQDDGNDESEIEDNFGLVRNDLTPKTAFFALKSISHIVKNAKFIERIDAKNPNIWILKFDLDGKTVLAIWNADDKTQARTVFECAEADSKSPLKIYLAGAPAIEVKWGYRNFVAKDRTLHGNKIGFTVAEKPLIVENAPASIKLSSAESTEFDETLRPVDTNLDMPTTAIIAKREANDGTPFFITDENAPAQNASSACRASYSRDILTLNIPVRAKSAAEIADADSFDIAFAVPSQTQSRPFTNFKVGIDSDGKAIVATGNQQFGQSFAGLRATCVPSGEGTILKIDIPASALGLVAFEKNLLIKFAVTATQIDPQGKKRIVKFGKGATGWPLSTSQFKAIYFN